MSQLRYENGLKRHRVLTFNLMLSSVIPSPVSLSLPVIMR